MVNELSEKDKKTLSTFSMYIQSYGSKVARTSIEVQTDGDVYWDFYGWHGDGSRMTIDGYDEIDDLIRGVIETEDLVGKYFDYDDRGTIIAIVNSEDGTLTFSADIYVMSSDSTSAEISTDEIPENMLKWIREMRENESYKSGIIHYSGGGDDGYIENDMTVNGEKNYTWPNEFEDYLLREIGGLGDWYNNDGGQGDVHINFIEETISIDGGINYEEEVTNKIDYLASFK
jgi:hypothetical protein